MEKLTMSLDDIVAANSRRKGIGSKFRKEKRYHETPITRNYKHERVGVEGKWKHDLFASTQKDIPKVMKKKTFATMDTVGNLKNVRINVSNLGEEVVSEDIQDMFDEFGPSRVQVNFDENGLCAGTADVFFDLEQSAVQAVAHYAGVALDGRQLKMVVMGEKRGAKALGSRLSGVPRISARVTHPRSDIKGRVSHPGKMRNFQRPRTFRPSSNRVNKRADESTNRFLDRLADDSDEDVKKHGRFGLKSGKVDKSAMELDRELDEYMSSRKK